jgi:hypothetical protein
VTEEAVRAAFADQARWCVELGSPFTARLCGVIAERLDRSAPFGRAVLDWSGNPRGAADALPMRVCGALHALVRAGGAPALAALYPPTPLPDEDRLWDALQPTLDQPALLPWLNRPPQTNEVGRSAVLMGGLLVVAAAPARPIELLELGASAGLNLNLDRYRYDLGGLRVGDPASPVGLAPDWDGPPPPQGEVTVGARRGVDLNPLDARSDREKLLAYVWPDQRERLARLEAAVDLARAHPPPLDRGDAADWIEARLGESQAEGTTRTVLHSVAYQYFPRAARLRIQRAMEAAGGAATRFRPLAWLRFELDPGEKEYSLRLRLWPGGRDRHLAWCHPHGTWVRWLSAPEH